MANTITTISSSGSVAALATTGTAIATILAATLGSPGPYRFTIQLIAVTAGAAADVNNVKLVLGSSSIVIPFTPASGVQEPWIVEGILDGSTAAILEVAASSTTIAYYGTLKADYLGPYGGNRR